MREKLHKPDPAGDGDEPRAIDLVRHLLKRVADAPKIDDVLADDPEALADILIDFEAEIEGNRLVQAFFKLLCPIFDQLAREHVIREYYLLNPGALAEESIARLYGDVIAGKRVRPLREWLRSVVERSATIGKSDPSLFLFRSDVGSSTGQIILGKICGIVNGMSHDVRRLAWLMFVSKKSYAQIAAETSLPLERCEMIIAEITMRAVRARNIEEGIRKPDATDAPSASDARNLGRRDVSNPPKQKKDDDLEADSGAAGGHHG